MGLFRNVKDEIIGLGKAEVMLFAMKHEELSEEELRTSSEIFAEVVGYCESASNSQLKREMKSMGVGSHAAMLNIVQNVAMSIYMQNMNNTDYLMGFNEQLNMAEEVYNYVNDTKLEKGYISKLQHEENRRLLIQIANGVYL